MNRCFLLTTVRLAPAFALAVFLSTAADQGKANAQSGSRQPAPTYRGSATRSAPAARSAPVTNQARQVSVPVAMEGYCAVCIINMQKWVKGRPEYSVTYDGKSYHFPGQQQKDEFLADPARYVPALGGDCTVCLANMGKSVPGNIRYASMHNGRLFLFPDDQQKNEFLSNPDKYANVDLAMEGNCSVCRVEMNQNVQGSPEFASVYQGRRYLFPSDQQKQMFQANPAKYAVR